MLEMIRMIRPTSKMALRQQCLMIAKGDVEEAKKLCDYYTEGMEELPMFDVPEPTWVDNTKNTLDGFLGWVSEHQDGLMQTYEFVRGVTGGKLPPLGASMIPSSSDNLAEPLPPINE